MPKYNQLEDEAERNKASLRWWYMKYHPDCEVAAPDGHLGNKRVVFTDTGCVTICDDCYNRLNVEAMYVIERPHRRGVLPALPLTPKLVEEQKEMDLGGC